MIHEYVMVPMRHWQYRWLIDRTPAAEGQRYGLTDEQLKNIEGPLSWTLVCDGEPVVCGGFIQQWPGRYMSWSYVDPAHGKNMVIITREVKKKVDEIQGRIEMTVRASFTQGLRWARLLGFSVETPLMRGYGPEGEDHVGFVRFNNVRL